MTLVWEDGASSIIRCPACGAESACPKVLSVANLRKKSETLALHECPECRSYFFHPMPDTNYTEGYSGEVANYHLLQGTSLEFALTAISALPQKTGRLLDVGCGPGFIVDLWERMELGEATGIEPSPMGKFAINDLHRRIRVLHLDEDTETPDNAFDIVFSTEVLEHVSDPASFLRSMSKKVASHGALIFSTPNVGCLGGDAPLASNLMEALSPGFHVVLFSEQALRRLLGGLGWHHVHLVTCEDHWIVYASREPLNLAGDAVWAKQMHRRYLERANADDSLSPRARMIFVYRLFRNAANEGNWEQTDSLLPRLGVLLPPGTDSWLQAGGALAADTLSDETLKEWLQTYFHLPAFFFLLGIRAKNHLREVPVAIQFFQLASRLARLTIIHRQDDAYTKEIYWVARLNAGATLLETGDETTGTEILEKIATSMEPDDEEVTRLLPQLKFATRARLEMFQHQVQRGEWQVASLVLTALRGWLSFHYLPSLLRISGWREKGTPWPEEWNPFWYFYSEQMLLLNLGRNAEAAQGFAELHSLCEKMISLPDARHFLPLSEKYAKLARERLDPPVKNMGDAKGEGFFKRLRRRLLRV